MSVLLALAILLSCVGWIPAQAQKDASNQTTDNYSTGKYDTTSTTGQPNHIARLYGEEGDELDKIVYLNADGSRTMYLYDYPVKYQDASGKIQDISLDIADGNTDSVRFRTAANSITTLFPANASDGITLSNQDVNIKLIPHFLETDSLKLSTMGLAKRIDSKTIAYDYDAKTTIEYSLTYTGFKEDIVVSEYTGQTEYEFLLQTNGLELSQIDGSFYLTDGSGTIKASIGDIIVFTADEKNNTMGTMKSKVLKENHSYLLTIVLDAEYLASPETAYPIRIDPTITINDTSSPGAIEDVTIYSNVTPDGASTSLFIGLRETRGVSRILMRFPTLNWGNSTEVDIHSATVTLRDLMCEGSNLTVNCHPFTGDNWTESTASWNMNQTWGKVLSSQVISYNNGAKLSPKHRYTFDITNLAKWWFNGSSSLSKGIIFKAADSVENGTTYQQRQFASYNRNSYQPTFTMTYTVISSTDNILQDNTPILPWYASYASSNCYGYAIGAQDALQPGWITNGYVIGGNSHHPNVLASGVEQFAELVESDLYALGYIVTRRSTIPPVNPIITDNSRLICIRTTTNSSSNFHFMVMEEDGFWYQKQGSCGPLKYTGIMDSEIPWIYEAYELKNNEIVYTRRESISYASDIWYISYIIPA